MSVGGYLEIYLTVFGWTLYGAIWNAIVATGLAYLPFIGMILRNVVEPYGSQEAKDASTTSLRRMEVSVVSILTVIVLAAQPVVDVEFTRLSYTRACGADSTEPTATATGGATGKTYDSEFTTASLGGSSAKIPLWWYALLKFTGGFDNVVILAIPCTTDLRAMRYGLENSRIRDPQVVNQIRQFYNDCWRPAFARFMDQRATLPPEMTPDDIYWPGSSFFLTNSGYYDRYRARVEIPGFPYDPNRDTEYNPVIHIPVNGRPHCGDWWNDATHGLRKALIGQIEPRAFERFRRFLPTVVGGITPQQADDIAIRSVFQREETRLTELADLESYAPEGFNGLYGRMAGQAGSWLEALSFYPKMYMVKVSAPIIQALVLMMFYVLLPFALVFSSYSAGQLVFLSVTLFAIKFWTVIWAVAHWLDNHLLMALAPTAWYEAGGRAGVADDIINFATGLMFIVFPLFWLGVVGWAGYNVGTEVNRVTSDLRSAGMGAGQAGGNFAKNLGSRFLGRK